MGDGAKRLRPQATQPNAWRVGNKLQNKAKWKQTLLIKERPCVLGRNDAKINTTSSSIVANGAPIANQPLPLGPPPSLTTKTKFILKLRALNVEAINCYK